ncbi:MAG: cyclic nucleotide-binding domain-containing protein [Myxococcota bacterium]
MLDQVRPCLLPGAEVRKRSDGTEGIYDPDSGHSLETTPEQANLVQLFDGKRSLLEISAEYMNRHGFVPFAAIDELLWGLADAGLLVNPPQNLGRLSMVDKSAAVDLIAPHSRVRWKTSFPRALRALELLLWPALGVLSVLHLPAVKLSPLDVLLFYPGLVLALIVRERVKAACCAVVGFPPKQAHLVSILGVVWYVAPDTTVAVLMDRGARVFAHLGALLGATAAVALASPWPGLRAGAAAVLLFDLCPLAASSMDSILAALSKEPHLRERLRSFVGLPLFKAIFTLGIRKAGAFLVFAGLLSVTWFGALVFMMFGPGFDTALKLVELTVTITGPWRIVTAAGAFALFLACPFPLILAAFQAIESFFTAFWPRETGGRTTGGAAAIEAFRSIPLFSALPDRDLALIAEQSREVTYGAGERIVEEGAPGNTFCSIRRGSVEVIRGEANQRPRVVARLGAGDCFGETAMLKDGVRTATVRAVTEVVVIELASEAFEKVVAKVGGVDFASVLRAASAIGKSKLFKELPPERLSSLASKFVPRSIPAGTDVVKFGEHGDEFFLIAKGRVEVLSGEGKKLVELGDGDVFGEIALLRNVPRTATVKTLTDTLVLVLGREVFLQALQADLALSAKVEEMAASRASQPAPAEELKPG